MSDVHSEARRLRQRAKRETRLAEMREAIQGMAKMVDVTVTFRNDNPNTIWNRLAAQLGREPTHAEARAEVLRILAVAGVRK